MALLKVRDSSFGVFYSVWSFLSRRRRKQFIILFFLTALSSLTEMLSLGSLLPMIGFITAPSKFNQTIGSSQWFNYFGLETDLDKIVALTLVFLFMVLMAGAFRLILLRLGTRLGNVAGMDLGVDVYRKTLFQPYPFHVAHGSNEIITSVTQKVNTATSAIVAAITLFTSVLLCMAIIASLFIVDPLISIVAVIFFGVAYVAIAKLSRKRLLINGKVIAEQQTFVMRSLREGLGAIREVLLDGTQDQYSRIYKNAAYQLQCAGAENAFINQAPRYAIETIAMVLVSLLILMMSFRSHDISAILPILGVLALGAQRLLPLMQQIYGNWSVVMANKASMLDVLTLLQKPIPTMYEKKVLPLQFTHSIALSNLSFSYQSDLPLILNQVNLVIPKGTRLGIIGATGQGKSTLLDVIMGLLVPTQGQLLIDDQIIDENNLRAWQQTIAHVPQMIFLADATFTENIAFGIPAEDIDLERVHAAAKKANAYEFIQNSVEGFNTVIGEQGVRLSGGQRQRIGIARALYKQVNVLCFDEATSALDQHTEKSIMETIDTLDQDITIIIIAHRLTTLKKCNKIIELAYGKIKHVGSYADLMV